MLLNATNDVVFFRSDILPRSHFSFINVTDAGNGRVLAARPDNGYVMIAEWDAGKPFYSSTPNVMVGGPRMFFNAGTQEVDATQGRWGALQPDAGGRADFRQRVGAIPWPHYLQLGSAGQRGQGSVGQAGRRNGDGATDRHGADDGDPYGTILYDWTMVSGPAAVTIVDHETATASVQFSERGVYEFKVTVHDYDPNTAQQGKIASDTRSRSGEGSGD